MPTREERRKRQREKAEIGERAKQSAALQKGTLPETALRAVPARPSIRSQIWSWGVVGTTIVFILGGGITFVTSEHTWIADVFFIAGSGLLLAKVLTWDDAKRQPSSAKRNTLICVITGIVLFMALSIWGNHYLNLNRSRHHLDLSAQQAQVVVIGVRPVPAPNDGTWSHVNVFYRNDGALPARSVSGRVTIPVQPFALSDSEILKAQDGLLSWNGWQKLLRSKRDEDLAHGVLGQWFSFPDHSNEESKMLAATLPRVLTLKWYAYVMTTFKYWDSSMDEDVLAVSESCVFFVNDLEINRNCGRNRTLLERQAFTHSSIVSP